jgi:hypothetical protein
MQALQRVMQTMTTLIGKQEMESDDAALLIEELVDIYSTPTLSVFGVEPKSCIDDLIFFTIAEGLYLYPALITQGR